MKPSPSERCLVGGDGSIAVTLDENDKSFCHRREVTRYLVWCDRGIMIIGGTHSMFLKEVMSDAAYTIDLGPTHPAFPYTAPPRSRIMYWYRTFDQHVIDYPQVREEVRMYLYHDFNAYEECHRLSLVYLQSPEESSAVWRFRLLYDLAKEDIAFAIDSIVSEGCVRLNIPTGAPTTHRQHAPFRKKYNALSTFLVGNSPLHLVDVLTAALQHNTRFDPPIPLAPLTAVADQPQSAAAPVAGTASSSHFPSSRYLSAGRHAVPAAPPAALLRVPLPPSLDAPRNHRLPTAIKSSIRLSSR